MAGSPGAGDICHPVPGSGCLVIEKRKGIINTFFILFSFFLIEFLSKGFFQANKKFGASWEN